MPKQNGEKRKDKAWVVSVTMGYGHLRAANPLRGLAANGHYLFADDYEGMPASDRTIWKDSRKLYETVSRFRIVPLIGRYVFSVLDRWQSLKAFYPQRDLSKPTFPVRQAYAFFRRGFMEHFIKMMAKEPMPLVTSFFYVAQAAEFFDYPNEIYCIICDSDMSRSWVALDPKNSRINYFAPNRRVVERLREYGVPDKNILLTGFPLPKERIGGPEYKTLKRDLAHRLANLDTSGIYAARFGPAVQKLLGRENYPSHNGHPLTLAFAVGGAGAQREMAVPILRSLKTRIKDGLIKVVLVAGNRPEVAEYFESVIKQSGLASYHEKVSVLLGKDKQEYFDLFNDALRSVDILWTKPSELSFYTALGIPIIIAPTIGSQEDFNSWWLRSIGGGIPQLDPAYCDEWLDDWLSSGWLARAAVAGFTNAPKRGTYRIEEIVTRGKSKLPEPIEPI
jgi:hypothetical protein